MITIHLTFMQNTPKIAQNLRLSLVNYWMEIFQKEIFGLFRLVQAWSELHREELLFDWSES